MGDPGDPHHLRDSVQLSELFQSRRLAIDGADKAKSMVNFLWRGFLGVVGALDSDIFLCVLTQAVARSRADYPQTSQGQG